ncbi:MAG: methylenetetrahydrofolate reductase [Gammaproteobacteria bacterium]|nr:methylenetetrahydrofolate reductase [Gammaproteobacteria bacterium]
MTLADKIRQRESGIVLYGMVPPKADTAEDKVREIAARQVERLLGLPIDGLVLYDIQDEATRTDDERPFPFMATLDCFEYSRQHLASLPMAKILYRAAGKYSRQALSDFLVNLSATDSATVFVGAASRDQPVTMSMREAYALKAALRPDVLLGGVAIPERHQLKGDEHQRVFGKIQQGCSFFVTQGVYDVNATKNFLSDYYYFGRDHGIPLVPMILTLTPCGSEKTLQFMKWLGISIPRWLENDLRYSEDILQKSVDVCVQTWQELQAFAAEKNIPLGVNVESVAVRKVEVDASIELLQRIRRG